MALDRGSLFSRRAQAWGFVSKMTVRREGAGSIRREKLVGLEVFR